MAAQDMLEGQPIVSMMLQIVHPAESAELTVMRQTSQF